jgi:DNA-binding beta-propeller fold protein YncE
VVAHRSGAASFMIDRGDGLTLVDSLEGFSEELLATTLGPDGKVWIPSSLSPLIARLGIGLDGSADVVAEDGLLYNAGLARVGGVTGDGALDARAVAFDAAGNALVLTRFPGTLVLADGGLQPDGSLSVVASIEVGVGPSRLRVASLHGREFAFVSCFDSRDVYVVDLVARELAAVVRGMTGPFEFEVDTVRERAYIADFRTSVIRVVDLAPMLTCLDAPGEPNRECAPELIGLVGRPTTLQGGI